MKCEIMIPGNGLVFLKNSSSVVVYCNTPLLKIVKYRHLLGI